MTLHPKIERCGVVADVSDSGQLEGRRSGFGRCPARFGVEHDQGAVRWPATRAGCDPARNLNEWPPGLARRGTRTGEVAKAVEPTAPATAGFFPTMVLAPAARLA